MVVQLSFKQETEDSVFKLKGLGVISILLFSNTQKSEEGRTPLHLHDFFVFKTEVQSLLFCSWRIKMSVNFGLM